MITDPAELRAGIHTLMDLIEEGETLPCNCGEGEMAELTCPRCNHAGGIRQFAKLLAGPVDDAAGEWICESDQGWVYEPHSPF